MLNKKTKLNFKEWNSIHWDIVYDFFNKRDIVKRIGKQKIEMNYFAWQNINEVNSEQILLFDQFYGHVLDDIFGRDGFCHYLEYGKNIKTKLNNVVDIKCFCIGRLKTIFNFVVYWVLVQTMFIASLCKEIVCLVYF